MSDGGNYWGPLTTDSSLENQVVLGHCNSGSFQRNWISYRTLPCMKRYLNNLAFLLRKGGRTFQLNWKLSSFTLPGREMMEGDGISLFGKEVSADNDVAHT